MTTGAELTGILIGRRSRGHDYLLLVSLAAALWGCHWIWLSLDTKPPVWDMALHQSFALNYLPGSLVSAHARFWELSANYPPFVHLMIALAYSIFHPGPHVAILANLPATLLLLWATYELARLLAGSGAARWSCILLVLVPYLIWMSRETILDYWLSAWVAVSLVLLLRTRGYESRAWSVMLGISCALGLLTKWLFAGLIAFPVAYICFSSRIWRSRRRMVHFAESLILTLGIAGVWYLPNLPLLVRYFSENAQIGAREGEPPVFSFQSLIYYLRLLEGYQLFALLFVLLILSVFFAFRDKWLRCGAFWAAVIIGGWVSMTLLRTKDPRFTMALISPLMICCGAWIQSWGTSLAARLIRGGILLLLCLQAYAINFGISWLPREIVLARGYQGSLRWDWNLYLQHYFQILGPPAKEDWQQQSILRKITLHFTAGRVKPALAVVPDMARFNAANFGLYARLLNFEMKVDHPQPLDEGLHSLDSYDYVVVTGKDQGMSWTTLSSRELSSMVSAEPSRFDLIGTYPLPNGDSARLYYHRRSDGEAG
jgi:4-amino-4-deoxy-L-arabinose transferase-like glycosyltransferase